MEIQKNEEHLDDLSELEKAYSEYLEFRFCVDGHRNPSKKLYQDGSKFYEQCNYFEPSAPKYHRMEMDKWIQEIKNTLTALERKGDDLRKERSLHEEKLKCNAEKVTIIIEGATKAYSLIDLRDWENIDLIIYYFETGRADDMKEALQLVDRQRQTDQITEAIEMASSEICRTINVSIAQLGSALAKSFSSLSWQLEQQFNIMKEMEKRATEQRDVSEAMLNELRAQAVALTSEQEMNKALLEDISDSSKYLAERVDRQMREVYGLY